MIWSCIVFQLPSTDLKQSLLQELLKFGTAEDGLCLLEGINLLITRCLANLEIFGDKVTALVELSIVVRELLKFKQSCLLVLIGLGEIFLRVCLLLSFVDHGLVLLLNRRIRLFDEILVCLLGILL